MSPPLLCVCVCHTRTILHTISVLCKLIRLSKNNLYSVTIDRQTTHITINSLRFLRCRWQHFHRTAYRLWAITHVAHIGATLFRCHSVTLMCTMLYAQIQWMWLIGNVGWARENEIRAGWVVLRNCVATACSPNLDHQWFAAMIFYYFEVESNGRGNFLTSS